MSSDRGKRLQHAFAEFLTRWWVNAESQPNGRAGVDILGTPGVAFECKTAREFRPLEWARQARKNAGTYKHGFADLPVVVWFPDGTGKQMTDAAMMLMPVEVGMILLENSGYAPRPSTAPRPLELADVDTEAG